MPDALFANPRLAAVYDRFDDDRRDLDAYEALVDELGAHSILDIGSGTGTFACRLALRGKEVFGAEPAASSIDVARGKPGALRVRWWKCDAASLPPLQVDVATMTGNVAQVFLDDAGWLAALAAVRGVLRAGGTFVFETRVPERRAWEAWTPDTTHRRLLVPGIGWVERWTEVTAVELPLVSFRTTFVFEADGARVTSTSTLRFRSRGELERTVDEAGFDLREIRDAPDRPGLELVVLATPRPT